MDGFWYVPTVAAALIWMVTDVYFIVNSDVVTVVCIECIGVGTFNGMQRLTCVYVTVTYMHAVPRAALLPTCTCYIKWLAISQCISSSEST